MEGWKGSTVWRERERDRQTDRQTDREKERERERKRDRHRERQTDRKRERERERKRERGRQTDRQRGGERERGRQTDRQTETEAGTDRESGRAKKRETTQCNVLTKTHSAKAKITRLLLCFDAQHMKTAVDLGSIHKSARSALGQSLQLQQLTVLVKNPHSNATRTSSVRTHHDEVGSRGRRHAYRDRAISTWTN